MLQSYFGEIIGLINAESCNTASLSRTQHSPQLSLLHLMPKNLFAVEIHNGNVMLVGLEPLLLSGLGDVDQFQFEGSCSPYFFNYE